MNSRPHGALDAEIDIFMQSYSNPQKFKIDLNKVSPNSISSIFPWNN